MCGKDGKLITTSLTLIDLHDISRSSRTYDVRKLFVVHPSTAMRSLARSLFEHWESGYGASYNPDRKEALSRLQLASHLEEVIHHIDLQEKNLPLLVATSAKTYGSSASFEEIIDTLKGDRPVLLLLGTGHGLSNQLLKRSDFILEPITGSCDYNHLSVRSACAILLDRLRL
jgi:hypothetical protein